jgi:hypothetical protein
MIRAVHIRGGHVNDSTDVRSPRGLDDPLKKDRCAFPKLKPAGWGPGLRAVDDNLDGADRIGKRLLVCVGAQLDDRDLGRHRPRDVIAQKFPRANDQMHAASDSKGMPGDSL